MMKRAWALSLSVFFLLGSVGGTADGTFAAQKNSSPPPEDASGFPSRDQDLDVLPGFRDPPPGYGEVPFWWWSGEDLDVDRMIAQVRELHRKGVSGVQVNYSHYDTSGWMTDQKQPPIFSEAWWEVYGRISQVCGELDMGIGLSTYTLDWPRRAPNLFYHLFYSKPELNAIELAVGSRERVRGGETKTLACPADFVAAYAYPVVEGKLQRGGVDLAPFVRDGKLTWTAPDGEWELWTFRAVPKRGSLNPLMAGSGDTVIRGFFQPFQDHNPDKSSKGLNYFFNDELHIGLGKFAWNPDFPEEFRRRKGYDLFDVLPAMWEDLGPITPKVRMDYADVRMSLMEERYFRPIYEWHASRGMIFACDSGGRGTATERIRRLLPRHALVHGTGPRHAGRQRRPDQGQGVLVHRQPLSAAAGLARRLPQPRLGRHARAADVRDPRELSLRLHAAEPPRPVLQHLRFALGMGTAMLSFPHAVLGAYGRVPEVLRASVLPPEPGPSGGRRRGRLSRCALRSGNERRQVQGNRVHARPAPDECRDQL